METFTLNDAIQCYFECINQYKGSLTNAKKADKHMDGFAKLLINNIKGYKVKQKHQATFLGYLLNKRWDIMFQNEKETNLLELKSIVLSKVGKCLSNRIEEAIGVAFDAKRSAREVKTHYFLVIEKDEIKSRYIDKIFDFLYYINFETKLYDNAMCIMIDKNNKVDTIYNTFEQFVEYWK